MHTALLIIQIVVSLVLSVLILIQPKGSGLGKTFGGSSDVSFSRRGVERLVYKLTFLFAFLFVGISILAIIV